MAYSNTDSNLALIYRFLYDGVMWLVGRNAPIDLHNFPELTGKVRLRSNPRNAQKRQQDIEINVLHQKSGGRFFPNAVKYVLSKKPLKAEVRRERWRSAPLIILLVS